MRNCALSRPGNTDPDLDGLGCGFREHCNLERCHSPEGRGETPGWMRRDCELSRSYGSEGRREGMDEGVASACIDGGGANSDGTGVTCIRAGVHQRRMPEYGMGGKKRHTAPGNDSGRCDGREGQRGGELTKEDERGAGADTQDG
eukprot:1159500-Rhodomonas_salina.2